MSDTVLDAVKLAEYKAKSDAACKSVLACKEILVKIMHECVIEYKDCTDEEIFQCIEGEPEVGVVPVDRDFTGKYYADKIKGNTNEDATSYEGTVTYDIQFDALLPGTNNRARLIINIEAQNQFRPSKDGSSYSLVTRGLYYCSRMISAQKDRWFKGSHYEDVCKVYSIWVCLQPPQDWQGVVNTYSVTEHHLFGNASEEKENYDKLCVILLCLGQNSEAEQSQVVNLLNMLLSNQYSGAQKEALLKANYGITSSKHLEGRIYEMCNYSDYVWETSQRKGIAEGMAKGRAEGRAEGRKEGMATGFLKGMTQMLLSYMKKNHCSAEAAMDEFDIDASQREALRPLLA